MSQSVIFMVPDALRIDDLERLLSSMEDVSAKVSGKPRELQVLRSGLREIARFRELEPTHEVAESYRGNGLYPPSWRVGLVGKRFFKAEYSNWSSFRSFLTALLQCWHDETGTLHIDDDYGEIWPAEDFLQCLKGDSAWDWRRSKSWHLSLASQQSIAFEDVAEALRTAHPEWGMIHSRLAEVRWKSSSDGPYVPSALAPTFYALRSESMPEGDPILEGMLSKTFGFSVSEHACFLFRFSDLSLTKVHLTSLLQALGGSRKDFLIDFDQDLVLSGEDALGWLDLDPEWDWR